MTDKKLWEELVCEEGFDRNMLSGNTFRRKKTSAKNANNQKKQIRKSKIKLLQKKEELQHD